MVPRDVLDFIGVWVGSPVGTLDRSAIFIDVVLKQYSPLGAPTGGLSQERCGLRAG